MSMDHQYTFSKPLPVTPQIYTSGQTVLRGKSTLSAHPDGHPANLNSSDGTLAVPWNLIDRLCLNEQLAEYFSLIRKYLTVEDTLWHAVYILRTYGDTFHPHHSSIFCSPPKIIWDLIVQLREHKDWHKFRKMVVEKVDKAYQQDIENEKDIEKWQIVDKRTSALSNKSNSHLSTSSIRSNRSLSTFSAVSDNGFTSSGMSHPSIAVEDLDLPEESQPDAALSPGKHHARVQRRAPPGYSYVCPAKVCDKSFRSAGHFSNHVNKHHPHLYKQDASKFLRPDPPVTQLVSPASDEPVTQVVNAISEAPAIGNATQMLRLGFPSNGYQFPTPDPFNDPTFGFSSGFPGTVMTPAAWYQKGGVQFLDTGVHNFGNTTGLLDLTEKSQFDDNSEMDDD